MPRPVNTMCVALALLVLSINGCAPRPRGLPEALEPRPLPEGYQLSTHTTAVGSTTVIVGREEQFSKVVIRIEPGPFTAPGAQRAAAKSYLASSASGLVAAGYKVTKKVLPDVDGDSHGGPIAADWELTGPQGSQVWSHVEIFFTDKAFIVQAIADDPATHAKLTAWARSLKPARPGRK